MDRHRALRLAAAAMTAVFLTVGSTALGQRSTAAAPELPVTALSTHELVEARGLSGLAVSPDGAYAVLRVDRMDVARNATLIDWMLVRVSDGHIQRLADAGAPRWSNNGFLAGETPQWSPDGAFIYVRRLQGEEVQLWRINRTSGQLEQLTHDPADVAAFIADNDGQVHYATGPATRDEIKAAENAESDNGVLIDATIIRGFPITHGFPVNGRMATYRLSPALSASGRSTLLGSLPLRARTLQQGSGTARAASQTVTNRFATLWAASYGGAFAFDPAKDRRLRTERVSRTASLEQQGPATPGESGAARSGKVAAWAGEDGVFTRCGDPLCTDADAISLVGWTHAGDRLILETRTFETVRLLAWNVETKRVETIWTIDGVLGSDESGTSGECQLAGEEAICIEAAADVPPRLVAIDLATGKERILFNPNPNLAPARLGVASRVTLKDRFGNATVGRVILPALRASGKRLPLVITSYTCRGFLLGGSGRDVPEHVLAGLGYASVCVDFDYDAVRRVPGFTMTQDNGYRSFLDFLEDAVRVLDAAGVADPARVSLNGFSGSATTTTFAIAQSDMFTTAAVTTEGSLDPIVCYLTAPIRSCEMRARAEGLSRPYDSPDGVLKNSPALNVEKIRTPLLMQLPEVEYVSMLQLYAAMQDYDRAVDMYVFADAYHFKNQPRQRQAVYDRNVAWIRFWLSGEEPLEGFPSGEGERWRALKAKQCKLFGNEGATRAPWYCPR